MRTKQTTSTSALANASLSVCFSNVNWDFLRVVYGWAAVQYQAWARGDIIVNGNETQHIALYTDSILEFWVDETLYFGGDYFTFRKAAPVLHLSPGSHRIDLRLVRDVRALGGIHEPTIDVVLEAQQASGTLELAKPGILMSDVVDGKLASPIAAVTLRNSHRDDIEIVDVRSTDARSPFSFNEGPESQFRLTDEDSSVLTPYQGSIAAAQTNTSSVVLVAGQTRPVAFNISLPSHNSSSVKFTFTYRKVNANSSLSTLTVSQNLTNLSRYDPHKITYLHPGGIVSYAMLRPPAKNAACHPGESSSLPVLLSLHGAGLEADNGMVAHALDPVADLCAWVLFPTGATPWSGDDWRG